jgi:basic membrane protein A
MKRKWAWLAVVLAFALVAAACGGDEAEDTTTTAASGDTTTTAAAAEPLKVAFVYVGPVGDTGWTWAHDQGREYLEANYSGPLETTFLENVPEGSESQQVFETLAAEGWDVIFGTSFGYMDPMLAAAEKYPDTVFEHNTGYKTSENMGNYFGAAEEGRYLTGMAAGLMTETNELGYVAAFPIPEVLRGINAFALGVKEVNPDATVQVVWTSTWFDPALEKQAAETLLDAGADVIAMHQDSPAPGEAAEARDAYWVGYNTDQGRFAPDAWLTAPIWNWGPYYLQVAEEVAAGTWETSAYYGDMQDGMVDIADYGSSVPQDVIDVVEARKQDFLDGSFVIFKGPLMDQDGVERLADGEVADLGMILGGEFMNFFVDNVIGSPTG